MNPVRNSSTVSASVNDSSRKISNGVKKIVVATPLYPPEIGGPATYVRELEDGLPERGIEIHVVKFSDVRHLPRLLRHFAYYRRVCEALKNADAVLALDPVSVGYPAHCAARKIGKPLIVKIVGDYAWEQGVQRFGVTQLLDDFVQTTQRNIFVRILQRIEKRVATAAKAIIVPSPYLKDIVSEWGIAPEKITVIHNGISIPHTIPVPEKQEQEFLIVSAGRRVPWKGFDAIERIARKRGWRSFIASGIPRSETLGWMKAADVFVLNSWYEGFPHALIEAMTLGTPVIATDTKFHRYLVSNGETGLLVPPGDDDALEHALLEVEKDPLLAHRRARAALKRMDEFSLPHMLDATAHFLNRL